MMQIELLVASAVLNNVNALRFDVDNVFLWASMTNDNKGGSSPVC